MTELPPHAPHPWTVNLDLEADDDRCAECDELPDHWLHDEEWTYGSSEDEIKQRIITAMTGLTLGTGVVGVVAVFLAAVWRLVSWILG